MPNWCSNNLSIYGHKDDMQNLLDVIKVGEDNYILLEALYPTPDELNIGDVPFVPDERMNALKEKYGYTSWYEWRIDKWGCKWPESDLFIGQEYTEVDDHRAVIAFNFETPWGPPIEAFNKISTDYPNLLFCLYYEEPGMGFCGKNIWANGECVESVEAELVTHHFDEEYLFDTYIKDNTTTNNN